MGFWSDLVKGDYPNRARAERVNSAIDAGFTLAQAEFMRDAFDAIETKTSEARSAATAAMGMAGSAAGRPSN
jgi:hypothetical protein